MEQACGRLTARREKLKFDRYQTILDNQYKHMDVTYKFYPFVMLTFGGFGEHAKTFFKDLKQALLSSNEKPEYEIDLMIRFLKIELLVVHRKAYAWKAQAFVDRLKNPRPRPVQYVE